jgi:cardiolipin-specific phospholipase
MFFWTNAAVQTAAKLECMKSAESKLLQFAKSYASRSPESWEIKTMDTHIPRSALPLKTKRDDGDDDSVTIHALHVHSREPLDPSNVMDTPLVILHGYMNAGAYFYRNFGTLANYFQSIYALDMLGWGLSSRPAFDEVVDGHTIKGAEDFFVESLEAWRSRNNIDRMILAGHSFGGYMSVAYCERYPERVERLLLLSPVGVPDENDPGVQERVDRMRSSWRGSMFLGVFQTLFEMTNPGAVLRTLSTERSYGMAQNYVRNRLPEISDPEESKTVADYLYYNAVLPGSGEQFLQSVLTSRILAKKPLIARIPNLKVDSVSFLYGSTDWMDITGGLNTQRLCETLHQHDAGHSPKASVYLVPSAGHLLMLQNPQSTSMGMIEAAGGKVDESKYSEVMPSLMEAGTHDLHETWLEQVLKARDVEKQKGLLSRPAGMVTA